MDRTVVLFTRDLRVHDNPALASAARAGEVVPLFVLDERLLAPSANRRAFLVESLRDLDASLRARGSRLHLRRGNAVTEAKRVAAAVGASAIHAADDASPLARRRLDALGARRFPSTTVVPLDELKPYRVFSPYYRRWRDLPLRAPEEAPDELATPSLDPQLELLAAVDTTGRAPEAAAGGETAGRARLDDWLGDGLARYGEDRGGVEIADERTSRLSPYLHFGCVSALEAASRAQEVDGAEPWLREVAWRDFYAQLLAARPGDFALAGAPRDGGAAFDAWRAGRTGYPLVDAGLRQLASEGWMHNRVRLVAASFLVGDLGVDWRLGARHFEELLVDGDVASNRGNWLWVVDRLRGGRTFSPTLQARQRDGSGAYVRRYVPELAHVDAPAVHEPWTLGRVPGYPAPIVERPETRSLALFG